MQLELLDKPDTSRKAAQARALEDARRRGDLGIERVMAKTDTIDPQWCGDALDAVRRFASAQAPGVLFTIELMRLALEQGGLRKPHDARSWGGIRRSAVNAGYIEQVRGAFYPAASSNGSPKPVYRKGPKA